MGCNPTPIPMMLTYTICCSLDGLWVKPTKVGFHPIDFMMRYMDFTVIKPPAKHDSCEAYENMSYRLLASRGARTSVRRNTLIWPAVMPCIQPQKAVVTSARDNHASNRQPQPGVKASLYNA